MLRDRMDTAVQRLRNLLITSPPRHVPEHLALPLGQRGADVRGVVVGAVNQAERGQVKEKTPIKSPAGRIPAGTRGKYHLANVGQTILPARLIS